MKDLKIKGEHNFKNVCMAYSVAKYLKIPEKIILKTIKSFKGLKHRLEFCRKIKINKSQSIEFYNDSASTNPNSCRVAILSFPKKTKIIILGGKDKNLNYKPLAKTVKKIEKEIFLILIYGQNKNKIKHALKKYKINSKIKLKKTLNEVVQTAYLEAKKFLYKNKNLKEIITIFSPAATSFDIFRNYADRGNCFKKLILNI